MSIITEGIIRGRCIDLTEDIALFDGQTVRVTIEEIDAVSKWGEGILRSAGAVADVDELDAVFAKIQDERKRK
jgi:hypothetical protein